MIDPPPQPLVRPYALTRGRTRTSEQVVPGSLVSTTHRGSWGSIEGDPRWEQIALLCTQVQSVTELATNLGLPPGVVQVMVGDMAQAGLLTVHAPGDINAEIDTYLLERVLSGLRKL
ncbi:MAG: DUF742 domain-containing protein, partial [Mycobacteriales bacterium]